MSASNWQQWFGGWLLESVEGSPSWQRKPDLESGKGALSLGYRQYYTGKMHYKGKEPSSRGVELQDTPTRYEKQSLSMHFIANRYKGW